MEELSSRDYVVYMLFIALCNNCNHNVFIRRWGSRNNLKMYKIIWLIKSRAPDTYAEIFKHIPCKFGDDLCLAKSIAMAIRKRLKSIQNVKTIGDLCHEFGRIYGAGVNGNDGESG